jgi:diguanylate cyclase (GGDEF)-like protein
MKKTLNPLSLAFITGVLISLLFAYISYLKAYTTHKRIEIDNVRFSFENALSGYRRLADFIYETRFKDKELLRLVAEANRSKSSRKRAEIRERIYNELKEEYQLLRKLGIKQFHIHLAEGVTSFIRFHRPELWGDSLVGVRKTLEEAMRTGKSVHGFEEGRIYSGFRNVYPLLYEGEVVGSVEISIGLNAVASQALMDKSKDFAKVIVKGSLVERKVFSKEKMSNYKDSTLNAGFLEDCSREESFWTVKNADIRKKVEGIDNLLRDRVAEKLKLFRNFSESVFYKGELYHVIFVPFKEINGDWAGYFVYYQEDRHWLGFSLFMGGALLFYFVAYLSLFFIIYRLYRKVMELKSVDILTGAWQRGFGLALVEKLLSEGKENKLSALFIDIDDFKKVNDVYGHKAGDAVLSKIARLIKERLRKKDIFLRYGGEEFLIILPDTELEGAKKVAEYIRSKVEREKFEGVGSITVSIGVAQLRDSESLNSLINRADRAMYRAKSKGKNRVEADV